MSPMAIGLPQSLALSFSLADGCAETIYDNLLDFVDRTGNARRSRSPMTSAAETGCDQ